MTLNPNPENTQEGASLRRKDCLSRDVPWPDGILLRCLPRKAGRLVGTVSLVVRTVGDGAAADGRVFPMGFLNGTAFCKDRQSEPNALDLESGDGRRLPGSSCLPSRLRADLSDTFADHDISPCLSRQPG